MKKYIPVFGDQSLFDNAPKDAVFVRYGKESYIFKKHIHRYTTRSLRNVPIVAMRRIEEVADSKLVTDGMPSFYVGSSGVCTHKFAESDIPVWCNDVDDTCTAMGFINDYLRLPRKPKRWTVADQQAGRLPEVGCNVSSVAYGYVCSVVAIDSISRHIWCQFPDQSVGSCMIFEINPIETPDEKAAREREEFVWSFNSEKYSNPTLYREGLRDAYDMLKTPTND